MHISWAGYEMEVSGEVSAGRCFGIEVKSFFFYKKILFFYFKLILLGIF
jgi:hypothetical protein